MGYYIEVPDNFGKMAQLKNLHGAIQVSKDEAAQSLDDPDKAVVVVMHNGFFEAAGFAYSRAEFDAFTDPSDSRRKEFAIMDRSLVKRLTKYPADRP